MLIIVMLTVNVDSSNNVCVNILGGITMSFVMPSVIVLTVIMLCRYAAVDITNVIVLVVIFVMLNIIILSVNLVNILECYSVECCYAERHHAVTLHHSYA
jgi:hypothetical protein